eukprot:245997-Pleurochrysis_carterae.AAC.2
MEERVSKGPGASGGDEQFYVSVFCSASAVECERHSESTVRGKARSLMRKAHLQREKQSNGQPVGLTDRHRQKGTRTHGHTHAHNGDAHTRAEE